MCSYTVTDTVIDTFSPTESFPQVIDYLDITRRKGKKVLRSFFFFGGGGDSAVELTAIGMESVPLREKQVFFCRRIDVEFEIKVFNLLLLVKTLSFLNNIRISRIETQFNR